MSVVSLFILGEYSHEEVHVVGLASRSRSEAKRKATEGGRILLTARTLFPVGYITVLLVNVSFGSTAFGKSEQQSYAYSVSDVSLIVACLAGVNREWVCWCQGHGCDSTREGEDSSSEGQLHCVYDTGRSGWIRFKLVFYLAGAQIYGFC